MQEKFSNSEAVILTEYRGLDVTDMAVLRTAMKQAGGEYKVYKNTLVRVAAKELNLEIEELLVGPTAIAFTGTRPDGSSGDPVSIAKALTNFAKDHEDLIIKGGMLEGALLSTEEITALSKIAPREELLARLAGGMAALLREFASLLNAVPQNFAYALSALIEAGGQEQELMKLLLMLCPMMKLLMLSLARKLLMLSLMRKLHQETLKKKLLKV